jgi:two-component system chemotaxis response regulator CheB
MIENPQSSSNPYRVLVVDDSFVVRGVLRNILNEDPQIQVIDCVGDGQKAIEAVKSKDIETVILDIEMPVMDGITALPLMLKYKPSLVVIVASTLTLRGADVSLKCLSLGAMDYIPKPTNTVTTSSATDFRQEILKKVKNLTESARKKSSNLSTNHNQKPSAYSPHSQPANQFKIVEKEYSLRPFMVNKPEALVIGCSTGGPQALGEVLKNIQGKIHQPIFIAQHMPPNFTKILADHLSRQSGLDAMEGKDRMEIEGGKIYISPGNFHMEVVREKNTPLISLNQNAPENFCRPSVNPLMRTIIHAYHGRVLGVMLTGMGSDGLQGAQEFIKNGGCLIAQDESSSVVWGMPKAVIMDNLCSAVIPLSKMGMTIQKIMNSKNPSQEVGR